MGAPIRSAGVHKHAPNSTLQTSPTPQLKGKLFTEAGLHRDPLATLGPPARDDRASALGLHARTKSVGL